MEDIKIIIGKNIRRFRQQRGQTLIQLSNQIGISHQQLSKIENGSGTSSTTLERIAIILGVDISTLMKSPESNLQKDIWKHGDYLTEPFLDKIYQIVYNQIIKVSADAANDCLMSKFSKGTQEDDWIQKMIFQYAGEKKDYRFTDEELLCFVKKLLIEFTSYIFNSSKIGLEVEEEE